MCPYWVCVCGVWSLCACTNACVYECVCMRYVTWVPLSARWSKPIWIRSQVTRVNKRFYSAVTGGVTDHSAMTDWVKGHTWAGRGRLGHCIHTSVLLIRKHASSTSVQSSTVRVDRQEEGTDMRKKYTLFSFPPRRRFHFGKLLNSPAT